jgi:hypothetical protein
MKKTKLIEALNTLADEEWSSFRRHVLMHTFEKSEIYKLFRLLQKKKNNFDQLGEVEFFRDKYYPHLSNKALSNLMAKLYQIIESWFALSEMKSSKYDEEIYLLRSLNRRGLYDQANYIAKKIENRILEDKTEDDIKSKSLSSVYHSQYYSNNPAGKIQLGKLIKYHSQNYIETSSLYEIELINWGNISRIDFTAEIEILKKSTATLKATELSNLLNAISLIFVKDDVVAFKDVSSALLKGQFTYDSELHIIVANYMELLSRKLFMKGVLKDVKEVTKIQIYSLELSAKNTEGRISSARFINIIGTLAYINTFDWTKKFIDKWIERVDSNYIEATKDLAYAQNCFYNEKFDKILNFTYHKSYDDIGQKLRAITLQLIGLYYDRKENYNSFHDSIINIKSFLNRNKSKLSASMYFSVLNLVNCIYDLQKGNKLKVVDLVASNQNIFYRSWLEKQLEK